MALKLIWKKTDAHSWDACVGDYEFDTVFKCGLDGRWYADILESPDHDGWPTLAAAKRAVVDALEGR